MREMGEMTSILSVWSSTFYAKRSRVAIRQKLIEFVISALPFARWLTEKML